MRFYAYGITDTGNVRSHNEDCVVLGANVLTEGDDTAFLTMPFLAAVCDGVGGISGGEVAAGMCAKMLAQTNYSSQTDLTALVKSIHTAIKKRGDADEAFQNMQTTLICLAVDETGRARCVNCGDSRLFLHKNGVTKQISTDHTLARYLYEAGKIDRTEMHHSRESNVITSALGISTQEPAIDITSLPLDGTGDEAVILCSDGVSDYVDADEIEICMGLDAPFRDKISALFELALDKGSTDNLSIIGLMNAENFQ